MSEHLNIGIGDSAFNRDDDPPVEDSGPARCGSPSPMGVWSCKRPKGHSGEHSAVSDETMREPDPRDRTPEELAALLMQGEPAQGTCSGCGSDLRRCDCPRDGAETQQEFTQEDVDGLRVLADKYDDDADNFEPTTVPARWLHDLADRIAARLRGPERADDGEREKAIKQQLHEFATWLHNKDTLAGVRHFTDRILAICRGETP